MFLSCLHASLSPDPEDTTSSHRHSFRTHLWKAAAATPSDSVPHRGSVERGEERAGNVFSARGGRPVEAAAEGSAPSLPEGSSQSGMDVPVARGGLPHKPRAGGEPGCADSRFPQTRVYQGPKTALSHVREAVVTSQPGVCPPARTPPLPAGLSSSGSSLTPWVPGLPTGRVVPWRRCFSRAYRRLVWGRILRILWLKFLSFS